MAGHRAALYTRRWRFRGGPKQLPACLPASQPACPPKLKLPLPPLRHLCIVINQRMHGVVLTAQVGLTELEGGCEGQVRQHPHAPPAGVVLRHILQLKQLQGGGKRKGGRLGRGARSCCVTPSTTMISSESRRR